MPERKYLKDLSTKEFQELFHEELFGAKRGEEDPNQNVKVIVSIAPAKQEEAPAEEAEAPKE
ncbi:MAG: hypothetical protein J6038_03620 [Bacilli bacterium]|nr:hypothetical protein [Bacilli bacterium]